jgi:hypothetical protein
MSSSHVQIECEKWIVDTWLPRRYGTPFRKQRLVMQSRGLFEFDAVSTDMKIIGNISTATAFYLPGQRRIGKEVNVTCRLSYVGSWFCKHKANDSNRNFHEGVGTQGAI